MLFHQLSDLYTKFPLNDHTHAERLLPLNLRLFVTAYEFYQTSKETWVDNEFIKIEGYADFEDEREYFIKGEDIGCL